MDKPGHQGLTRLNKFLADCGVASRRKADELITAGSVQINGKTTYELGGRIDPKKDRVTVNGKAVHLKNEKVYIAFFKPENVLTSTSDPDGRPTVMDFFRKFPLRIFPVGRLDWDTEGLILLTNDGDFAQRVAHPKEEITKTYLVKLNGHPTDAHLKKLMSGVPIPGGRVRAKYAAKVKMKGGSKQYDWVKIVITEGKNRQVRFMFEKIGFDVKKLRRVAIGQLRISGMKKGEHFILTPEQIRKIFAKPVKKIQKPRQKSIKKMFT